MIDISQNFTVCPDKLEAKQGCEFCKYENTHDYRCMMFDILGEKRLALQSNFCPLTGELSPDWAEERKIFAVWPDGTTLQIRSINNIKQRGLYTFEAQCDFVDRTSAWVPFDYIKNEEEQ